MAVGTVMRPALDAIFGPDIGVSVRWWDGSTVGPVGAASTVVVSSPLALRRLLFAPNALGLARGYVAGELDVEGDLLAALRIRDVLAAPHSPVSIRLGARGWSQVLIGAARAGALGKPVAPPAVERRKRGRAHTPEGDAAAIAHHYDVSNDFYRLFLGESMTYSAAVFADEGTTLDDAQWAKHERVCRKLDVRPGIRLLDVGCGWGAMVLHAARHHGASAVGITISSAQYEYATKRVAEAGLAGQVEIRLQDYRAVDDGPYDAISSIGMFEHVGAANLDLYLSTLHRNLAPGGRLLNEGASRGLLQGRPGMPFIDRYAFPDYELFHVGTVGNSMERNGFEVRDVENLREHYAMTLREWLRNLESHWSDAERFVGTSRARVWRLYLAGTALYLESGRISTHQLLASKPRPDGISGMPLVRDWLCDAR